VIDGSVYDITDFWQKHPGGKSIFLRYAGQDASEAFNKYHPSSILELLPPSSLRGSYVEDAGVVKSTRADEKAKPNIP
jgi:L-lactate dehydrogenase (cytochrome)